MSPRSIRTFQDKPAVRDRVPILVGLVGPSGGGKTYSALELAHGIQEVVGGEIGMIDTEARRGLHYAGAAGSNGKPFKFLHLDFGSPFSPLDYLAAIEHFTAKGVKTVIVDSMSHEHEGPGGVLEMHDAELDRLAGDDWQKRARMTMLAWQKPKSERRALINALLQKPVNFIFCFRAKEKLKMQPGKDPVPQGWQPIAGEEFVFEMTLNCLLPPAANGVPDWEPYERAERAMIKLPQQFKPILTPSRPLSVEVGRELAKWAEGSPRAPIAVPVAATTHRTRVLRLIADNADKFTPHQLDALRTGRDHAGLTKALLDALEDEALGYLEINGTPTGPEERTEAGDRAEDEMAALFDREAP